MIKIIAIILILWLPFSLACLAAIPISLWAIISENSVYAKDVMRCMDKLLASLFGWSGYYTLSAELHYADGAWVYLRRFLDWIQAGHCEQSAFNEGLK